MLYLTTKPSISFIPFQSGSDFQWTIDNDLCECCHKLAFDTLSGWDRCNSGWTVMDKYENFFKVGAWKRFQRHHDGTVGTLYKMATTGCGLCGVIAQELQKHREERNYEILINPNASGRFLIWIEDKWIQVFLWWSHAPHLISTGPDAADATRYSFNKDTKVWHEYFGGLAVIPGDFAHLKQDIGEAKKWMSGCKQHEICSDNKLSPRLPKRVLDLGVSEDRIVLYISKREGTEYATLSYCWGQAVPLRTTKSNIDKHINGISLSEFPQTLRDAILITRELGFRYLWIDALCIVQDNHEDWLEQAADMANIYERCALNICAAASTDCEAGILRNIPKYSCHIGSCSDGPAAHNRGYMFVTSSLFDPKRDIVVYQHEEGKLWTRGWVLQEILLSPSSLMYTHQGIEWMCRFETLSPTANTDGVRDLQSTENFLKRAWAELRSSQVSGNVPNNIAGRGAKMDLCPVMWHEWVVLFSSKQLTKSQDKLPACAGFASRYSEAFNVTYVAGLWKEHLLTDLTWMAAGTGRDTRCEGGAPTWSWASVNGDIRYHKMFMPNYKYGARIVQSEALDLQVLDVAVEETIPGSFGEVKRGQIEAVATLQRVVVTNGRNIEGLKYPAKTFSCHMDTQTSSEGGVYLWCTHLTSVFLRNAPMATCGPYLFFLLLEQTGVALNEFRRIGVFWCDCSPFGPHRSMIPSRGAIFPKPIQSKITIV